MNKRLISCAWMLLLAVVLAIPLSAQQVTVQVDNEGGLWDALEAQGITDFSTVKSLKVTGTLGSADFQLIKNLMTNLEDVDLSGTTMTEVPEKLFVDKQALKTVRLPEKVTHFYMQAFCRCGSLISVTFGNQVATTGKIVFPASFRRVENEALYECLLLTHLDFTACTSFEGFSWNACANCNGLQEVLFPSEGNVSISGYCFNIGTWQPDEYGHGLQELTLTKAITYLEDNCLPNNLKKLYVESITPPNCTDYAFDNIEKENLTVYVPKGSKKLYAVANGWTKIYTRMQELGFKVSISGYGLLQKGNSTYSDGDVCFPNSGNATTLKAVPEINCELISVKLDGKELTVAADGTFTIPAETMVGTLEVAFTANMLTINNPNGGELISKIQAMDLNPKTVRALKVTGTMKDSDWQTVRSMIALQTLDLTQTDITVVPSEAMKEHKQIREVLLPSDVTEIGDHAFTNCIALQSFPIGHNVTRIGYETFQGCSGISTTALVLPQTLQSVGGMAFYPGSSSLKAVDMSQCRLTSDFSYYVFDGYVQSIKLPQQGNYRLDYHALEHAGIKELTIPGCVTEITEYALPSVLQTLYVQGTSVIPASSNAFNNISNGVMVYVPTGLSIDYQFAGGWSKFQNFIEHGFLVKTNGHGVVCSGGNDYQNGSICFPTIGRATTMQVVPNAGYEIDKVTLGGAPVALNADGTFTIPATSISGTLEVTFTNKQLNVAISMQGAGTYTINGQTYTAATTLAANGGEVMKIQLQPATGYFVKKVTINDEEIVLKNGGLEVATKELDENTTIAITFSNEVSSVAILTFQQEGFGAVNYSGETFEDGSTLIVDKGKNLTLEFVPNGDSSVQTLVVNDVDVTADVADNTFALNNVTANITIKTLFFSPNMITVENPNGGELKDLITAMGSTPRTIRTLKVVGMLTNKDWNFVMSTLSSLEIFDISETNVKSVPESAFRDHQYLTTVHLPSTVTNIGSYAFYNCLQLTTVDGCDNVEEIGERSFDFCSKFANFPFGNKIRSLGPAVFESCSSLPETLVMPASLTFLGWDNVFNNSSVRSFDLSQCTLSCNLAYNTFGKCTSLLLPEKGDYQLYEYALNEALLTELRLPAAVSGIYGDRVLPATLERLYVTRTEPICVSDNNAFANIDFNKCTLYVPVGSLTAYSEASGWLNFTNIKEFGFKVKMNGQGKLKYDGREYNDEEFFFPMQGQDHTMQIIPSPGYELATLKVNGIAIDYTDDGTFTIPAAITGGIVEATFTNKHLEVAISLEGNGTYIINGIAYFAATTFAANGGDVLKMQLQPAEGYFVKQVTINGEDVILKNGGLEISTPALDVNTNIAITFSNDVSSVATVTFLQEGFGAVNYGGETFEDGATLTLVKGKSITLEFVPSGDSNLQALKVNNTDVTADVISHVYVLNNVTANTMVSTTFFSPNMIAVENPNGGELKEMIAAMGSSPATIRALKVIGKMNTKDWNLVRNGLSSLETFDISETNVKSVPESAFREHQNLTTVHLPLTVTSIGSWAFQSCPHLTTVDGCDNVEEIAERSFGSCPKLTNFPFGNKLRSLSSGTFESCSSLPESLVMPASVTSLGWDNVFNWSSIRSFDLSQCTLNGSIAYDTFGECTSLKLPENGDYSLSCGALKNAQLTELRLPAAVSNLDCDNVLPTLLEHLYVSRTEPIYVGNDVFKNLDADNCILYVPVGSKNKYENAIGWMNFANVKEYGLQVVVGEQGKVRAGAQTLMGTATYFPTETTATFEILPNAGWHTESVILNGTAVAFDNNNKFTLNADQLNGILTITFAINQFNLDLQIAGNGKVKLGSLEYSTNQVLPVDSLSKLNFTLEPAEGLVVSGITFNGKESVVQNGGLNYVTPAITANSVLAITFGEAGVTGDVVTYTITTSENGTVEYMNTSLLPQTTIQVKKGKDAVFTLKPDDYCILESVLLNGNDVTEQVDENFQLIVKDVKADATLEVTFAINAHIAIELVDGKHLNNALTDEQKQMVTKLTVTGQLWEDDYYTMRDKMPLLAEVDLSKVDVSNMDYVPYKAFCVTEGWDNSVGKTSLESIQLPEGIRYISEWAFSGCSNLKNVNFTELKNLEGISTRAFGWTGINVIDLSQTKITSLSSEFYKVKGLENVKLPKTINYLGDVFSESGLMEVDLSGCTELKTLEGTFRNSKKLEKVMLPEGLTIINGAFSDCNSLTTVNFPKSLQSIGSDAFYNTKIQFVDLSSCSQLVALNWGAFRECHVLDAVLLPSSLQSLSEYAFYNTAITAIDLSNTQVQDIKESTFNECRQLENVKLPAKLKTIGSYAFYNCEKLAGMIELPATVVSVGEAAFWGSQVPVVKCNTTTPPAINSNSFGDKWEAAFVPEGYANVYKSTEIWEDKVILDKEVHADVTVSTHLKLHGPIGAKDFAIMRSNMTLLYDLDLEDADCSIIPENAFRDKKVLMNVKLPRELLIIQENAFQGCSSLKGTLTLPEGVTTIGWAAFQGCSSLEEIVGCSSLEEIVLSPALEVIRGYAFEGCTSLQQEITFPQNFTSIGEYAFANCRNLTGTLKFNSEFYMFMGNEGYWSSTGRAFENCSNIKAVDMSECEYLYQLPMGVFSGCNTLETVMLPPYLERIESYGFAYDTNLRNIKFPTSLMYLDDYVFNNCTSLKRIDLSSCENFATIGWYAFTDCSALETVSLSASLNWIQSYAFSGCRKLAELNVEALQPADLGEYVFRYVHTERCVLSIPTGTYADYLSTAQWGEFVTMRKAIDVSLDEGATLTYTSGGEEVAASRSSRRAPSTDSYTQEGNVNVKDGSSLYVAENENVTFYINPDENVSIKQVLFNGEDVTGQLQANAFVTPGLTENASFKVLLNVDGPITVKELRMLSQSMNIRVAESAQIAATVYPTNATNKTILWSSSDENVATVADNGTITGINAGHAIITAKTEDGNFEQKCELVVMSNDYYITLAKENNAFVENTCMLPIMLHNADAAQGIQFDVYLPEGLGMDYDWSESFGVELSSRSQGHRVTAARRQDGSVRVIVYSLNGQPFSGNDGELLTLPISTREEVGDYKVEIKNIHISGPNSFNFTAPDYATNIRVADYPLGDSNGNGEVSVFDATNTVDQILERYTDRFIRKAADVNHDGIITVSDVTGTIDIILERPMASRATHRAASDTDDKVFIDDFKLTNGQQQTISLQLTNTELYTAFQCDIVLPEGLTVAEDDDNMPMVSICGANANNHIVQTNYVSSGALRLLVMSMNNSPFEANVNNVVNLTLEANAATPGQKVINIDNVRLVNAESRLETVAASTQATVDIVEETTNINSMAGLKVSINNHVITVIANADTTLRLVSVDGKQRVLTVKAGTNSFFIPQSGIYMLQGRKIVIK